MVSIFLSSLYSIFLTFLGTLSTLDWSLYSMIFFSKGTYSILLSPLITSFPVLTVVPTIWALVVVTLVAGTPVLEAQYPAPTAYSLLTAPDPLPQTQLVVVVVVAGTQLEVVVATQFVFPPQLAPVTQLPPVVVQFWLDPEAQLALETAVQLALEVEQALQPMGSPVFPSMS